MTLPRPRTPARMLAAGLFGLVALSALVALDAPWPVRAHAGSRTQTSSTTIGDGYAYGFTQGASSDGSGDDFEYALIGPGSRSTLSISGQNRWDTIGRLGDEVASTGRDVFWFALDDRDYVVRDRDLVARAREILEPVCSLGAEQGRLGRMQGEMGRRQGKLGRIQGRMARIEAWLSIPSVNLDARDRAERAALRRELDDLRDEVRALSREQRDLGERQRELGAQQAKLGQEQARASQRATVELRALAHRALEDGKAESLSR
jgi:hypothetical protein